MKSLVSLPLVGWEALQLYIPASVKTRSLKVRTEDTEEVPLVDSVILALNSTGEPSLYQEMSGSGIPEAEQVNDTVSVMLAVVSMGISNTLTSSVQGKRNEELVIYAHSSQLHVSAWSSNNSALELVLEISFMVSKNVYLFGAKSTTGIVFIFGYRDPSKIESTHNKIITYQHLKSESYHSENTVTTTLQWFKLGEVST